MYTMVCTMPDIGHGVRVVSRFMENPWKDLWEVVKWILKYLRGITEKCLYFGKAELKVQGYVDANFGGEIDHRRSIVDYIFTVGTIVINTKDCCFMHYKSWVCRINISQ